MDVDLVNLLFDLLPKCICKNWFIESETTGKALFKIIGICTCHRHDLETPNKIVEPLHE